MQKSEKTSKSAAKNDARKRNATKKAPKPPVQAASSAGGSAVKPNAVWFKPVMFGLMLLGLAWILVHYISSVSGVGFSLPIPGIGSWNILIGFGIVMTGFLMATRWR